jgi:hypothetical protein
MSPRKHDFSPTPSEVLRYFIVWLRGFHRDREKSKVADWAMVLVTALGAVFVVVQIRDTKTSFKFDERARVELESVSVVNQPLGIVAPFGKVYDKTYEVYPKNVGKTFARKVKMKAVSFATIVNLMEPSAIECVLGLLKPETTEANVVDVFDHSTGICRDVAESRLHDFGRMVISPVLAPDEKSLTPYVLESHESWKKYDEKNPKTWQQDVLVGRIDYVDEFDVSHWKTFCIYHVAQKAEGETGHGVIAIDKLLSYMVGNDEDQDSN